jgi:hypothetical protein
MVIFQVIPSDLDMFISCDYHVLSHKKEPRKDIYWSSTDHLLPNLPETHHVLADFTMHLCDSILQLLKNIFEEGLEISSVWSSKNAKMWLMISTYLNASRLRERLGGSLACRPSAGSASSSGPGRMGRCCDLHWRQKLPASEVCVSHSWSTAAFALRPTRANQWLSFRILN